MIFISKPLIIFEVANNHMGDEVYLKSLINKYYNSTLKYKNIFDFAIKFQFRDLKTFIDPNADINHPGIKRFTSTYFDKSKWKRIVTFSKKKFKVISTPFDEISVNFISQLKLDYIKIASCSYNDWSLIEKINKCKLPIICSLGGANENDIEKLISFFSNKIKKNKISFLYCVAKYPTSINELNLDTFRILKEKYGSSIKGFSTHENPDESMAGALAFAMGSRIFEKHIFLENKKYQHNKYSSSLRQTLTWLENLKKAKEICGSYNNRNQNIKVEKKQLHQFQRGIFVKKNKNLKKNDLLNDKNITMMFPARDNQLLANEFSKYKNYILKKKKIFFRTNL